MPHSLDRTIPRRTFLRGAAGLLGATALGIPSSALSAPMAFVASDLTFAVMYWNGSAFVPAQDLSSGDQSLGSVQVTLHGFGTQGEIRWIDLVPLVRTPKGTQESAFYAWTAPPNGLAKTRCTMPVDLIAGLHLSTRVVVDTAVEDILTPFTISSAKGPKLREGSYVLCAAKVSWKGLELRPDGQVVNRLDQSPVAFQYVVASFARA
jgi:hypothetical protein